MKIYYRLTFALQFMVAVSLLAALLLPWHTVGGTAFELLQRPLEGFRFPYGFADSWWLIWLIVPLPLLSVVRSAAGLFQEQWEVIEGRRYAFSFGICTAIALTWFHLIAEDTAFWKVTNPHLEFGFWLTGSSLVLLMVLIWTERILPKQDPRLKRIEHLAPDDPERLWEGHFRLCSYCGSPNEPVARRCQFCGIVMFPETKEKVTEKKDQSS